MDIKFMTYDDVYAAYKNNRITAKEVAEWFPLWCVGKGEYRFRDGVAENFCYNRIDRDGGEWRELGWINKCIYIAKNMGQS